MTFSSGTDVRSGWRESRERRVLTPSGRGRAFRMWGGALAFATTVLILAAPGTAPALADDPAAKAGAASAEVVLRKGDRGRAVKAVQRKLRETADGVFGPATHRAVKRFQKRRKLTVDGIVGPQTRRAMKLRAFSASSVIRPRKRRRSGSGGGLRNLPKALIRIADCESGGDPEAISPSGRYRGKYQFMKSTWKQWGGRGDDPAEASEAHQDRVALRLYRARGAAPWPNCGS